MSGEELYQCHTSDTTMEGSLIPAFLHLWLILRSAVINDRCLRTDGTSMNEPIAHEVSRGIWQLRALGVDA